MSVHGDARDLNLTLKQNKIKISALGSVGRLANRMMEAENRSAWGIRMGWESQELGDGSGPGQDREAVDGMTQCPPPGRHGSAGSRQLPTSPAHR